MLRGRTRTATRTFEKAPTRGSWDDMARAMARPVGVEGRDVAVIDAALSFRGDAILFTLF